MIFINTVIDMYNHKEIKYFKIKIQWHSNPLIYPHLSGMKFDWAVWILVTVARANEG